MKSITKRSLFDRWTLIIPLIITGLFMGFVSLAATAYAADQSHPAPAAGEHLITVYDNGKDRGILTRADTLGQALQDAGIHIDPNDRVEPGLDQSLVATNYEVNIYRARPVTITDGSVRVKVMSAHQTPGQIAQQAGISLQPEDDVALDVANDIVADGTGLTMEVDRATEFTLVLYGKRTTAYTQAATVGDMLAGKDITLDTNDSLSVPTSTVVTAGMTVELWRNGIQTVSEDHPIPFETEKIQDADREVGYKQVKTPGVEGKRVVTYEVEMKNGQQVARKEIQSVVEKEPTKQVEVVGTKIQLPAGSHEDWMRAAGLQPGDFGYANAIFQQESTWRPAARNPAGYVGLGQTNEANLSAACPNWQSDPICQIRFFDGYAKGRYGSWHDAYVFKFGDGVTKGRGWW